MSMHESARQSAGVVGGVMMATGGGLIAQAPSPIPVGSPYPNGLIGLVLAVTGLFGIVGGLLDKVMDNRKLKRQLARAHEKIDELEQLARGNKGNIAGIEAKADESISTLVQKGLIEPARPGHAQPFPTLLVVEDDPGTVRAMNQIFTHGGWSVHSATTIGDALVAVEKGYHYVLLDLKLATAGDGLAVLRHLYECRIASRVVVHTGSPEGGEIMDECHRLAPDAILRKPFRFEDLKRAVDPHRHRPDDAELDRRAALVGGSGERPIAGRIDPGAPAVADGAVLPSPGGKPPAPPEG